MAPEVICRMNHSFEADYFALGVIVYEMMLGSVHPLPLSDPISVILEKKSEIKSLPIRPKSLREIYHWDGACRQWTS